ncbi:MAG TPA: RDD family protein [Longimicrobiaceae bacterium]
MDPQAPETRSQNASYAPPTGPVAPVAAARPDLVKRVVAALIDFVGIAIVSTVLSVALSIVLGWVGAMAAAAVGTALALSRDILLEGRSPGKKLLGMAVVRADGGPITVQESVRRNATLAIGSAVGILAAVPLFGLLAFPLYFVALAVTGYELYLVANNQPRLGDKLAGGTQVVFQGQAAIAF